MDLKKAYEVTQAEWVKIYNVEVGDKVRCKRHFAQNELGFDGIGSQHLSDKKNFCATTSIGEISKIYDSCISVDCGRNFGGNWHFPWFVLKVVEQVPPEKMIEVAGKKYSESTLVEAMKQYVREE